MSLIVTHRQPGEYYRHTESKKHSKTTNRERERGVRQEYKFTKKVKVISLVNSEGKILAKALPTPCTAETIAKAVKSSLGPWLKSCFPDRKQIRILLDGEQVLHTGPAKAAWDKFGIKILEGWPKFPTERQVDKSCTYMHGSTVKLEAHSEPSNWSPWERIQSKKQNWKSL